MGGYFFGIDMDNRLALKTILTQTNKEWISSFPFYRLGVKIL